MLSAYNRKKNKQILGLKNNILTKREYTLYLKVTPCSHMKRDNNSYSKWQTHCHMKTPSVISRVINGEISVINWRRALKLILYVNTKSFVILDFLHNTKNQINCVVIDRCKKWHILCWGCAQLSHRFQCHYYSLLRRCVLF